MEAAPTCFGLQRNHHQGATSSAQLKLQVWFSGDIRRRLADVVSAMASQYDLCGVCVVHCASVIDIIDARLKPLKLSMNNICQEICSVYACSLHFMSNQYQPLKLNFTIFI